MLPFNFEGVRFAQFILKFLRLFTCHRYRARYVFLSQSDMLAVILAAVACFAVGTRTASFRAPVYGVTSFVADVDRDEFKIKSIQRPMRAGASRAHRANPIVASNEIFKIWCSRTSVLTICFSSKNYVNLLYFIGISLGNPPQIFRSIIDTTWSDLFVPSSECQSDACRGHYRYNSSWSSTYEANGTKSRFRYFGLRADGSMSKDTLYVAGLEIKNQSFCEILHIEHEPIVLGTYDFDAVLGLAPANDASLMKVQNPLTMMVSQGLLDSNVISLALGATVGGDRSLPGEIMFGGVNEEFYEGEIVRIPLTNVRDPDYGSTDPDVTGPPLLNGTWQVEAHSLAWGDSKEESSSLDGFTARIDSSYPFIDLPQETYEQLKAVIKPDRIPWFTESIDCERRAELPDVTFDLGGHNFTLTPYDYTLEMMMGDYGFRCLSAFQQWDTQQGHIDIIVLGSAFLRAFYSVFDYDNKELGCKFSTCSKWKSVACVKLTLVLSLVARARFRVEGPRNGQP